MASLGLAFDILAKDSASAPLKKIGDEGERTGDRLKTSFAKLGDKLKGGLLAAGAIAGTALYAGISGALENQTANAKLGAQLGLSPQDTKKAGQLAGSIYKDNFGENLAGINAAIKNVVNDIGISLNSVDLKPITEQALGLADVFDQDVGGITRATGQLLRTGLAKNAKEALDIIAKGFQAGDDKAGDFLDTLNEYGTQFRKLGIDGKTATGLLSQGLKAGARDGDLVADALKEFSIRAIDGSELTKKGFKDLGLNASKLTAQIAKGGPAAAKGLDTVLDKLRAIKDPATQAQIATSLFGTQAEDLGQALFALDPSGATKGLGQFAGAAQKATDAVGSTGAAKLETFKRKLKSGIVDFITEKVVPAVSGLYALFRHGDYTGDLSKAFGLEEDSKGTDVLFKLRDAFIKVGQYVKSDVIPALRDLWGFVKGKVVPAYVEAYTVIGGALKDAFEKVGAAIERNRPQLEKIGEVLKKVVEFGLKHVLPIIAKIEKFEFKALGEALSIVIDTIGKVVDGITAAINTAQGIATALKDAFVAAFNFIAEAFNNTLGKLSLKVPDWVPKIGGKGWEVGDIPLINTSTASGGAGTTRVPGSGRMGEADSRRSGGLVIEGDVIMQRAAPEQNGEAFVRQMNNLAFVNGL